MYELWADIQALPWFVLLAILLAIMGIVVFVLSKDKLLRRRNIRDRRQSRGENAKAGERRCGTDRRQ